MNLVRCLAGEYVSEAQAACAACPDFHFNSVPGRNAWCEPCTPCFKFSHAVHDCNKTHDNICDCDDGYIRSSSNPKFCVINNKSTIEGVHKFTESNFVTANFSSVEQAVDNAITNISATTDHDCWTPWLPGLSCLSQMVAFAVVFIIMFSVCLLIYICYLKSRAKRQQPDAAMIVDPEKNPVVDHQQQVVQEEKQGLLWEQGNQNSFFVDKRGSLSQFNSGGSDQSGIDESSLDVDFPAAVRPAACDEVGASLPPSSLCQQQEYNCSSLNLREDEDLTPLKKVAEAAGELSAGMQDVVLPVVKPTAFALTDDDSA